MKICSICQEKKELNQFYSHKRTKDGKYASCKKCEKAKYDQKKVQTKINLKTKVCSICKKRKRISNFHKNIGKNDGFHTQCKMCRNEVLRREEHKDSTRVYKNSWSQYNKESIKNSQLKSKFGITLPEYNELLFKQENKCAICNNESSTNEKDLAVDHCHKTGKIRGLLCHTCNLGLGHLKDDINLLNKAVDYLKNHQ
jgi:hypothetical protein